MSKKVNILTKRQIKKIAGDLINKQNQIYSYKVDSDLFKELKNTVGDDATFLIDEFLYSCLKEAVDARGGIDLDGEQFSLNLGYGEKVIKLPDFHAIKVCYANIDHMRIQKGLLVDNYNKQIKAFEKHHDQIVVPIINTMVENNLATAGEALLILCKDE